MVKFVLLHYFNIITDNFCSYSQKIPKKHLLFVKHSGTTKKTSLQIDSGSQRRREPTNSWDTISKSKRKEPFQKPNTAKVHQRPIQSVNCLKTYRVYRQTDIQTNTYAKTWFSGLGGLKTWRSAKNLGGGGKFYTYLIPSLMKK